jgi:hypothetical protein
MAKSELARTMDELQSQLHPLLKQCGFRKHGRTYNRTTADGITHVIGFQMGSFDPPGITYFPGLRENLYGRFTVNLGVYVPEVARDLMRFEVKSVAHDCDCYIRTRLGRSPRDEIWWNVCLDRRVITELTERFQHEAFPLFQRFESRDHIINELRHETDNTDLVSVPRLVCAVILLQRGERDEARRLLAAQARDYTRNPNHPTYVIELARRLGVEITS